MTIFAILALLGWPAAVLVLFVLLPARRATVVALVGGWLLLPPFRLVFSGLPDYSKNVAATLGILIGTMVFAPGNFVSFRPRWYDLPMLVWCFCPVASSLSNGLTLYDGLSTSLVQILIWGLPYLIGRMYFHDIEGMRELIVGIAVGGLFYVPLCLWEIRMSPQLMKQFYGSSTWQGTRLGGYRPHVFFNTGLELGMWMTAASLAAWWLWSCGALRRLWDLPFGGVWLPILLGTTVLCRSTGALALLLMGMGTLWCCSRFRSSLPLWGIAVAGVIYVAIRAPNLWSGQQAVDLAQAVVGRERAKSLEYRFMCENLLVQKAMEQPVFGWGGWGRSRVYFNPRAPIKWRKDVATDGLWVIVLGNHGSVGLGLMYLVLELPIFFFLMRFPVRLWKQPAAGPAAAAATLLGIYIIDCLLNAFPNIIYITMAGGLIALKPTRRSIEPPRPDEASTIAGTSRPRLEVGGPAGFAPRAPGLDHLDDPRPRSLSPAASTRIRLADRYRAMARIAKEQGRPVEAQATWQHALDLLVEVPDALANSDELQRCWCDCANDLAWFRVNYPDPAFRDPAFAIALIGQATGRYPDCAAYWNTLGAAYYRAGDPESAIAALERSAALGDGGTSFDFFFLSMAFSSLDRKHDAGKWFDLSIISMDQYHPRHPELLRLRDEASALLHGGSSPEGQFQTAHAWPPQATD